MKLPLKILIALILFIGIGQVSAQSESEKNTSINLQFGLSTPFGLPANSSSIIPQLGLDFNFGKFGFRATEQFFKTSPEFDINEYLEPFGSDITQTGVKEKSSNFVMGIIPYLNLQLKDNFLLQPALGLKYLIQNGATNYVTYTPDPRITLLEYPVGDSRRSSFVIDPSIRAVFGKASKPVHFYVEAGYAITVGNNEVTYSYLDLTNILTPGGAIDPDLLGSAPKITGTQKMMPHSIWIGIGLELNITSSPSSINHNTGRSNRTYPRANIEKDPDEGDEDDQQKYNAPLAKSPVNGLLIRNADSKNPITLGWIPVIPKPRGKVIYKVKIIEIKQGQSAESAAKTAKPLLEKKVINQTQLDKIILSEIPIADGSQYGWFVRATNKEGKPYGENNGTSNVFRLKTSSADVGVSDFQIDCDTTYGDYVFTLEVFNDGTEQFSVTHLSITPSTVIGVNFSPTLPATINPNGGTVTFTGTFSYSGTNNNIAYAEIIGNQVNNIHLTSSDTEYDTISSCPCTDCDSLQWNFNLNANKLNDTQYNLQGNLDVNLPIYGVEFQVLSYSYTPTPSACSNGITKLEESGMLLLPETTINGTSVIQAFNETISGSSTTNNKATKTVKLMSTTPITNLVPVNLSIGLPGAITGMDPDCCIIKYKVCIKATVFYDAEQCKTCTYIKCIEFTNQ